MSFERQKELLCHFHAFWPKNRVDVIEWNHGPILEKLEAFRVCRIAPASRGEAWIYITLNTAEVSDTSHSTEYMILSPVEDMTHVEMLAVVAFYNITYPLALGKVLDIGREWMGGSKMHQFLVSLPYPFGPALEWASLSNGSHVRFLWLLPITEDEAEFATKYGVDALEKKFDEYEINPVDPSRKSVVGSSRAAWRSVIRRIL